jgi:hypothetical protein
VLTSMTLVIVPLELVFHAPLQSQGLLQDAGSALQPYPQPTEAPSFVSQPVISQQPPFAEAIFTFVRCESPGVTPLLSSHCCSTTPAAQGWAEKASTSCQRVPARNSDKSSGSIGGVPACQQLKCIRIVARPKDFFVFRSQCPGLYLCMIFQILVVTTVPRS